MQNSNCFSFEDVTLSPVLVSICTPAVEIKNGSPSFPFPPSPRSFSGFLPPFARAVALADPQGRKALAVRAGHAADHVGVLPHPSSIQSAGVHFFGDVREFLKHPRVDGRMEESISRILEVVMSISIIIVIGNVHFIGTLLLMNVRVIIIPQNCHAIGTFHDRFERFSDASEFVRRIVPARTAQPYIRMMLQGQFPKCRLHLLERNGIVFDAMGGVWPSPSFAVEPQHLERARRKTAVVGDGHF